jgi:hypothetical protein
MRQQASGYIKQDTGYEILSGADKNTPNVSRFGSPKLNCKTVG